MPAPISPITRPARACGHSFGGGGLTRSGRISSALLILLLGVGVAAGLAVQMRFMQSAAIEAVKSGLIEPDAAKDRPRQVAAVARAIRAMNLVTVEIDTTVTVSTKDESWMGDVLAEVRVPTTLYYGVDLAKARVDTTGLLGGPIAGQDRAVIVAIPPPRRIATEVFTEREQADVSTGWLRFKSVAGEKYLGLARKLVSEDARRMILRPQDAMVVRDQTRQRVAELVAAIVGERVTVRVDYDATLADAGTPVLLGPLLLEHDEAAAMRKADAASGHDAASGPGGEPRR